MRRTHCSESTRRHGALRALAVAGVLVAACAGPSPRADDDPRLSLLDDGSGVELSGLAPGTVASIGAESWPARLTVHTRAALEDPQAPPVLGTHGLVDGRVLFTPRFPFTPGVTYVARYRPDGDLPSTELEFSVAPPHGAGSARVTAVFPSADVWPMNQLKMYVHFSAPMRRGRAFEHIQLIDEDTGAEVAQPFVTVQEELWDRDRRVLTVLFDPARIKRGLAPHEEAGLPLRTGGAYRLVVEADWLDDGGRPLAESFTRSFRVGDPDRASPDPHDWSVATPAMGSRDPVVLRFPEPMDHGLLHSLIGVRRAPAGGDGGWHGTGATTPGDEIAGTVEVSAAETEWRFRPEGPWLAGSYELVVPTVLEDLAGNTPRGLFDADLGAAPGPFAGTEAAFFGFSVGPPR